MIEQEGASASAAPDAGRRIGRLAGVDTIRALAALAVLVCHAQAYCLVAGRPLPWPGPQVLNNGAHGVDLFVVVSGFCLALPLASGGRLLATNFYRRRALRILPAYYAALLLTAPIALSAMTARYLVGDQATGADVLLHMLLLQSVVPGHIATINGSLWSVALEVHLYLLFPITLALYRRLGARVLLPASAVLSVGWGLLASFDIGVLGDEHLLPARLVQFVAGMWVAERVAAGRLPRTRSIWLTVMLGGFVGLVVSTANVDVNRPGSPGGLVGYATSGMVTAVVACR